MNAKQQKTKNVKDALEVEDNSKTAITNRGPGKLTREVKAEFCAALIESGGNVSEAARTICVARQSLYAMRERDDDFAVLWEAAIKEGTEVLEQEMYRRAVKGTEEPVFYQGDECGTVRKYSDTLAIFLAKARDPAKYRDHVTSIGPPIQINIITGIEGTPGCNVAAPVVDATTEEAAK